MQEKYKKNFIKIDIKYKRNRNEVGSPVNFRNLKSVLKNGAKAEEKKLMFGVR